MNNLKLINTMFEVKPNINSGNFFSIEEQFLLGKKFSKNFAFAYFEENMKAKSVNTYVPLVNCSF